MAKSIKPETITGLNREEFESLLKDILDREIPPSKDELKNITSIVNIALDNEDNYVRPYAKNNKPGGLLKLSGFQKTIILPDLHARRFFMKSVLFWENETGKTVIDMLENDSFNLLCLGDGVHSEGELATRWVEAYQEFVNGYKKHTIIDQEISDSFNLMIVIMLLKIRYKHKFNFIKGNHENIMNETGNGNFSFAKFANEGAMVYEYFKKFYGNDVLKNYYNFEKRLPLFVVGANYLASHAEPSFFTDSERIINYANDSKLIESLTWTENYTAEKGTVDSFLTEYLGECTNCYYFGGHRPIKGLYNRINNDRYVQIHNPYKKIAVVIDSENAIDLENDIVEVPDYIDIDSEDELQTVVETDIDYSEHFKE